MYSQLCVEEKPDPIVMKPFRLVTLPYPALRAVLDRADVLVLIAMSLSSTKMRRMVQAYFARNCIKMRIRMVDQISTLHITCSGRVIEWCLSTIESYEADDQVTRWDALPGVHFLKANLKVRSCGNPNDLHNVIVTVTDYILQNFNSKVMDFYINDRDSKYYQIFECEAFKSAESRRVWKTLDFTETQLLFNAPKCKSLYLDVYFPEPNDTPFNTDAETIDLDGCSYLKPTDLFRLKSRIIRISGCSLLRVIHLNHYVKKWVRMELEDLEFLEVSEIPSFTKRLKATQKLEFFEDSEVVDKMIDNGTLKLTEHLIRRDDGRLAKLLVDKEHFIFSVLPSNCV